MSKERTTNYVGGLGFGGALTIAFIVLKLTKVIAWSWWWVLSPIWVPIGLGLSIFLIGILFAVFISLFKD